MDGAGAAHGEQVLLHVSPPLLDAERAAIGGDPPAGALRPVLLDGDPPSRSASDSVGVLVDLGPTAVTVLLGAAGSATWAAVHAALARLSRLRPGTTLKVAVTGTHDGARFSYRVELKGTETQVRQTLEEALGRGSLLRASGADGGQPTDDGHAQA